MEKMNYYEPIKFERKNGFEAFKLKRFHVPPDGHCLFHSLLFAFYVPYKEESLHGKSLSKLQIVINLRHELADRLDTVYESLSGGNICKFAEAVPEFKMDVMINELRSNHYIGYGYIEYISNLINKDIYIINGNTCDIYISDELPYLIKGRTSIVLYYKDVHYEPIGLWQEGKYYCHFKACHPFIKFLRAKIDTHLQNITN